jgi:hypothetical protein
VPHRIGRHVHPAARPDNADPDEPTPATGIDHLKLVHDRHTAALTQRVTYADLTDQPQPDQPQPDQPQPDQPQPDQALEAELASFGEPNPASEVAALVADLAAIADADPADSDQLDMFTLLETLTEDGQENQ